MQARSFAQATQQPVAELAIASFLPGTSPRAKAVSLSSVERELPHSIVGGGGGGGGGLGLTPPHHTSPVPLALPSGSVLLLYVKITLVPLWNSRVRVAGALALSCQGQGAGTLPLLPLYGSSILTLCRGAHLSQSV